MLRPLVVTQEIEQYTVKYSWNIHVKLIVVIKPVNYIKSIIVTASIFVPS